LLVPSLLVAPFVIWLLPWCVVRHVVVVHLVVGVVVCRVDDVDKTYLPVAPVFALRQNDWEPVVFFEHAQVAGKLWKA
jgi:hypothetical protein